jgi:hypothetical protein
LAANCSWSRAGLKGCWGIGKNFCSTEHLCIASVGPCLRKNLAWRTWRASQLLNRASLLTPCCSETSCWHCSNEQSNIKQRRSILQLAFRQTTCTCLCWLGMRSHLQQWNANCNQKCALE